MKNEFNLTQSSENISKRLRDIEKSDEYAIGKKIYSIKPLRWILRAVRRCKDKHDLMYPLYNEDKNTQIPQAEYKALQSKRVVIYTCVTGEYDTPVPPLYKNSNYDYVLITNNEKIQAPGWRIILVKNDGLNNLELNRYYKMHPQDQFSSYDYSIYVDGNLEIINDLSSFIFSMNKKYGLALSMHPYRRDILSEIRACRKYKKGDYRVLKQQVQDYIDSGFPINYGLIEAPVIVTDLKNHIALDILDQWWKEFLRSGSGRDQISLPYVLWKNNILVEHIGTLSNDIFRSAKFEARREHNK